MNKYFTLAIFLLFAHGLFAQSFSVSADSASASGPAVSSGFNTKIYVYNELSSNLQLRWVRTQQIMPPSWRTSVCNEYYCFSIPDDSAMFSMVPGDSDFVEMNFYPYGTSGNATITVKLYAVNDPADYVILTFYGDAPVGIEEHYGDELSLYPDPAADVIHLHFTQPAAHAQAEIFDAVGRSVMNISIENSSETEMNTSDLSPGYYFLRLTGNGKNTVKRFIKK
jgi:hypothetical protein